MWPFQKKNQKKKPPKFIFKEKPFLLDLGQMLYVFLIAVCWDAWFCSGPGFMPLDTNPSQHLCLLISFMSCWCLLSGFGFWPCGNSLCACVLHSPPSHHRLGSGVFFLFPVCGSSSCSLRFNHLIRVVKHTRDSSEQIRSLTSSEPVKLA